MKNFRSLRESIPMSQQKVVRALNVSVGTVVNWDSGRGTTDKMKDKICELFVCSREELEG